MIVNIMLDSGSCLTLLRTVLRKSRVKILVNRGKCCQRKWTKLKAFVIQNKSRLMLLIVTLHGIVLCVESSHFHTLQFLAAIGTFLCEPSHFITTSQLLPACQPHLSSQERAVVHYSPHLIMSFHRLFCCLHVTVYLLNSDARDYLTGDLNSLTRGFFDLTNHPHRRTFYQQF